MHNFLKLKLCFKKKELILRGHAETLIWLIISGPKFAPGSAPAHNQKSVFCFSSSFRTACWFEHTAQTGTAVGRNKAEILDYCRIFRYLYLSFFVWQLFTFTHYIFFFLISVLSTSYKLKTDLLLLVCRNWRELFHHCRPPTSSRLEPKQ